jgi:predicted ester cyclase
MSAQENKAVLRRVIKEVMNEKNLAVVEELYSEEYVTHPSLPGRPPGHEVVRRNASNMHATFPDGEWVAIRATLSGTHEATGKRITWPIAAFVRFNEGKIAEDWLVADTGQIEAQLGSLPQ